MWHVGRGPPMKLVGLLEQVLHRFEASGSHVGLALEATKRLVILVFWTPAPPSQTVPLKYINVHERRAQEGACSIIRKSARQELGRERGRCEFKPNGDRDVSAGDASPTVRFPQDFHFICRRPSRNAQSLR